MFKRIMFAFFSCALLIWSSPSLSKDQFEAVSYASYRIIGFIPSLDSSRPDNQIYVITKNPRMALWFIATDPIAVMTSKVATGALSECKPMPENYKRSWYEPMIKLHASLPLIEATYRQRAEETRQTLSETENKSMEAMRITSRFFAEGGLESPYFVCKS